MKIDFKDISFIVQGSIGLNTQGLTKNGFTDICIKSIRKYFPNATIILSTWKGSDTKNLDYDILLENNDPGPNQMGDYNSNCFRQIVSTINGLKMAKTKYAFKIRTDIKLCNNDIIDYFIKYNESDFDYNYKLLNNRVVTLTTCNPYRRTRWPFNVCDWIFFGLTEDLINIFDIPLINEKIETNLKDGNDISVINPISPEQYIWTKFLLKYVNIKLNSKDDISNNNIELSEKYFANNCIFLNARQAGIFWQKNPGMAYAQTPALSNSGLYTFNEYKQLLNRYANNKLIIIPNIPEMVIYVIVYKGRFLIKKILKILKLIR